MKPGIILPVLLATFATSALAKGLYVTGQVTHSNLSLDEHTFDKALTNAGATGLTSSSDGSGEQWRLQAGYQFNPYFAIEGGYIDLGTADYKAEFAGGAAKGHEKAGGVDLTVLGIIPATDNLAIFAKAGLIAAKVETRLSSGSPAVDIKDSTTEVRPLVGAGVSWKVMQNVDLRFDYDHVSGLGKSGNAGKMDDNMVSAGISYHF
ncbi:MAG TPA: outer membrane beta-barrel protein [Methylophilaceae bacterium]|nr:outer membrane beta-barrel protein [Methylophilaceae bacterium]